MKMHLTLALRQLGSSWAIKALIFRALSILLLLMVTGLKVHSWLLSSASFYPTIGVPVKKFVHQQRTNGHACGIFIPSIGGKLIRCMKVPLATFCTLKGCGAVELLWILDISHIFLIHFFLYLLSRETQHNTHLKSLLRNYL